MIGILPDELSGEVLFHDSLAVLTSAKNPLTRRRKLALAELMNEPWALLPSDSLFGTMVDEAFRAAGHEPPRPTLATLSKYMMDDLLATGRFLTVLPSFMLKVETQIPGAQGAAGRIAQHPQADRTDHLEEPDAHPARTAVHRQHPRHRQAHGAGGVSVGAVLYRRSCALSSTCGFTTLIGLPAQ